MSSLYTSVPKLMSICMPPEIWSATVVCCSVVSDRIAKAFKGYLH